MRLALPQPLTSMVFLWVLTQKICDDDRGVLLSMIWYSVGGQVTWSERFMSRTSQRKNEVSCFCLIIGTLERSSEDAVMDIDCCYLVSCPPYLKLYAMCVHEDTVGITYVQYIPVNSVMSFIMWRSS